MTKDWIHRVGHSPVCQILLQIVVRAVITSSPPAWTSSAGMLSTSADFPFFNDCTAASTSHLGPFCNDDTNERGLRLLEFATFNDFVLANTFGHHIASRRRTWHSPNGQHHNQINYILVRKRFRSGVNIARTRSFPRADIGSDHDLLMMTFRLRLKKTSKPKHTRLKYDLEKLKDPNVL